MQRLLRPIFISRNFFCSQAQQLKGEVQDIVYQVLKEAAKCNQRNLKNEASFNELGFDSLDQVELVVAMEERFNIDIDNEEAEKIVTVGDCIDIFAKHMKVKINAEQITQKEEK